MTTHSSNETFGRIIAVAIHSSVTISPISDNRMTPFFIVPNHGIFPRVQMVTKYFPGDV